jgi:hypothetical protein
MWDLDHDAIGGSWHNKEPSTIVSISGKKGAMFVDVQPRKTATVTHHVNFKNADFMSEVY